MLNPNDFSHAPSIAFNVTGLAAETIFMVDTGAAPNLIKKRSIHPDDVDVQNTIIFSGITDRNIATLGSTEIYYMGHAISLHVVNDNFPISQEGILGSDFFRDAACINFE